MDVLTQLKEATENLKDAHGLVYDTTITLAAAKRDLAGAEFEHTLAGLEGKNAEARKAELAVLTRKEQAGVDNADMHHRKAQIGLTLAELDYKLAREALSLHKAELLARAPLATE